MGMFDGMGGGSGGGGLLGPVTDMFHGITGGIFGSDPNKAPQMIPPPLQQPAWPGAPVPQGIYNVGSYPGFNGSLAGPGPSEQYWANLAANPPGPGQANQYFNQVHGQPAPQGSNYAQQAYQQFQGTAPMNLDPFYDRAMKRGTAALNAKYAGMGLGGSSFNLGSQQDMIADLMARQAKDEADYGLARGGVAGGLARGADTSSQGNAADILNWTMGLGGLAGSAQQGDLAQMLGLGSLAGNAQGALQGRAQSYLNNLMGLSNAQAGATTGITMPMLGTNLSLLDEAMQAYLGYPRQSLNQTASDRASSEQGLGGIAGLLGALL